MGVITLKIDNGLKDKLRKRVGRTRGAERGAISQSVEQAIRLWLKTPEGDTGFEEKTRKQVYVATKNGKRVAETNSLSSLSMKLKEARVDPRDVTIESIPETRPSRRMGLRTTALVQTLLEF